MYIQPTNWLEIVGVTQDSRVFFNHHVATAPPYQEVWDIREAYVRLGSSTEGWIDLVGGRQMFSFGDERVIGPSDWLNMGRTFDTVRVDLHHPGVKVSIFGASVIYAATIISPIILKATISMESTAASHTFSGTRRSSPICCGESLPASRPFPKPRGAGI